MLLVFEDEDWRMEEFGDKRSSVGGFFALWQGFMA